MRSSIRTKFLLLISTVLLVIFGTITIFQIKNSTASLRKDLFDESKAFASLATEPIGNVFVIYKDSGTLKIDEQVNEFIGLNESITNIAVVDINGRVAYSQNEIAGLDINAEEAGSFTPLYQSNDDGVLQTIIYPYFEASGARRYSIVYTVSDQKIETAVRNQAIQLLYFGFASLLLTMALVYFLIDRFIISPVRQVSEQASVISAGNLGQQIRVRGHDEIASLGDSVNKMAESLKANIAKLQEVDKVKSEFMMITSHNLRTPLTIIDGYLDNMDLVMGDPEKVTDALKRIGSSVKRLEIFAEDILTISRFELGDTSLQAEEIEIGAFLDRVVTEFIPTAELKELEFKQHIENSQDTFMISPPYMRSAIWNVLDNAAKFTKTGGSVSLMSKTEGNFAHIIISDTGIGISPEELPKLFTKFHRGTSTLTYDFEGTGIGLYSSKVMIERHGGTISASSELGKGSTFIIKLPIAPAVIPR